MVQEGELALIPDSVGAGPDSVTAVADTVTAADSVQVVAEPLYGIILTPEAPAEEAPLREEGGNGVSFIFCGLFVLFLIISLRFRNNLKYAVTMFRNLVETRMRQNVFDDTVRETSLIVLLNILWCASAGIVGFCVFQFLNPEVVPPSLRYAGMLIGMAVATVYFLFMWGMYGSIGWIFSDKGHATLWIKGFSASQALMGAPFFVTALVAMSRPELAPESGAVAAAVFILVKLVFIWKGIRIFFSRFSSWLLFLCYLCSLEIVPLVLCYRCAVLLDNLL